MVGDFAGCLLVGVMARTGDADETALRGVPPGAFYRIGQDVGVGVTAKVQ